MEYSPDDSDFYSNIPTAVIPTENGTMWRRVDPFGTGKNSSNPTSPMPDTATSTNKPSKHTSNTRNTDTLDSSINLYPKVNVRTLSVKNKKRLPSFKDD